MDCIFVQLAVNKIEYAPFIAERQYSGSVHRVSIGVGINVNVDRGLERPYRSFRAGRDLISLNTSVYA
jgi:hypothetical protein